MVWGWGGIQRVWVCFLCVEDTTYCCTCCCTCCCTPPHTWQHKFSSGNSPAQAAMYRCTASTPACFTSPGVNASNLLTTHSVVCTPTTHPCRCMCPNKCSRYSHTSSGACGCCMSPAVLLMCRCGAWPVSCRCWRSAKTPSRAAVNDSSRSWLRVLWLVGVVGRAAGVGGGGGLGGGGWC